MKEKHAFLIAALGYIGLFVLAIFANFWVFEPVYVPADVAATAANIAATPIYSLGGIAFALVAILDIIVAWALYYVFKKRSEPLSLIAAILRIVNAVLLAAATPFFLLAKHNAAYLEVFHSMWMVALLIFGVHLFFLAALLYKRSKIQTVFALFLVLAGLGYVADTVALFTVANYAAFSSLALGVVATLGIIGELGFTVWVFVKAFTS